MTASIYWERVHYWLQGVDHKSWNDQISKNIRCFILKCDSIRGAIYIIKNMRVLVKSFWSNILIDRVLPVKYNYDILLMILSTIRQHHGILTIQKVTEQLPTFI